MRQPETCKIVGCVGHRFTSLAFSACSSSEDTQPRTVLEIRFDNPGR
jgi:hypothetical protein